MNDTRTDITKADVVVTTELQEVLYRPTRKEEPISPSTINSPEKESGFSPGSFVQALEAGGVNSTNTIDVHNKFTLVKGSLWTGLGDFYPKKYEVDILNNDTSSKAPTVTVTVISGSSTIEAKSSLNWELTSTTILLRLLASPTTTTAKPPDVGYLQPSNTLPITDTYDDDIPQGLHDDLAYKITSAPVSPSLTPLILTTSTRETAFSTTAVKAVDQPSALNNTRSILEEIAPTNDTIIFFQDKAVGLKNEQTVILESPNGTNTSLVTIDVPNSTTIEAGMKPGTLLAILLPLVVVAILALLATFLFVRRRKKKFIKHRKTLHSNKENLDEQIELSVQIEDARNISTEKLYAKVDKSRKSRISTNSEETVPLTSVHINGGPGLNTVGEVSTALESDVVEIIDNDLYERDSDDNPMPNAVANYPDEEETYEIPEDIVSQRSVLSPPPVPPERTSSSPRNSAYFSTTPPVPHRLSSLTFTTPSSRTPPLPPRHSSLQNSNGKPPMRKKSKDKLISHKSKSNDNLDTNSERTPKIPPRLSLVQPKRAISESPKLKRATVAGSSVPAIPIPLTKRSESTSLSESEGSSSDESSDFEELPPPLEHAPDPPCKVSTGNGASKNADESEYLEPVNLKMDSSNNNHDYDPVYIPSSPGASHIEHLVDNTNYIKGARNRSPSKASINPYEEIHFGSEHYADVDESTMTSPPQTPCTENKPIPPKLTARSLSRSSEKTAEVSPRPISGANATPGTGTRTPSSALPQLPPRSPSISSTVSERPSVSQLQNGTLNLPKEPRYSGLLDACNDNKLHEYTALDYEEHQHSTSIISEDITDQCTNTQKENVHHEEGTCKDTHTSDTTKSTVTSADDKEENERNTVEYDPVPIEYPAEENPEELYEPIEGADKDGIYEAIDFADE